MPLAVRRQLTWVVLLVTAVALPSCSRPISADAVVQPGLTTVSPSSGTISGSTLLTLTGTSFALTATVTVGDAPCLVSIALTPTTMTCLTPAASSLGAVDVAVTNRDFTTGTSLRANLVGAFTYTAAGGTGPLTLTTPTVSAVSPTSGTTNGGTIVTLTGTNFNLTSTVSFGGRTCMDVLAISSTSLTCTVPSQSATGPVAIIATNRDLTSLLTSSGTLGAGYNYTTALVTPTITATTPLSGSVVGGLTVTLTGTGFDLQTTVAMGGRTCRDVVVASSTSLSCTTPSQSAAGAVNVVVTNHEPSTLATASATQVGGFTYAANVVAPSVTLTSPVSGTVSGGTTVTLTGTNFDLYTTVSIGARNCKDVVVNSATSLTCTTPSQVSTGAVNVVVTNHDPITLATLTATQVGGYTYLTNLVTPTLTLTAPASGTQTGGTTVTITGTGFDLFTTVSVGGRNCTDVVVTSSVSLSCTTPSSATAAAADVIITNHDLLTLLTASATQVGGFTYTAPSFTPVVTSISPAEGPVSGSTVVTVTGSNYNLGSLVSIGGQSCTNLIALSTTQLTCRTPAAGGGGVVDVVVTNRDLNTGITYPGTLSSAYTYNPPPTFTSSTQGFFMGSDRVTVTGTGFRAGAVVTINNLPCASVLVSNATTLSCLAPAGTPTTSTNIVLTNIDAQTVTGTNGFTWRQAAFGTFVDGNGADGIGHDLTKNAKNPSLVEFNGSVIVTSQENNGTADNIRAFRFNGNDTAPVWASLDGGLADGLNNDPTHGANLARPVVFGADLWMTWEELNGTAVSQIRAQRFNGDGSIPLWSSMDGGSLNRNVLNQATAPSPAAGGSNLFVAFLELNTSVNTEIRVKKWDGVIWSNFDTGSAENGLNVNPSKNALAPSMVTLAGRIYLAWQETSNTNKETIQVACNEDETASGWQYTTGTGLNHDLTHHARNPRAVIYNNKVYVTWTEDSTGGIAQVRVARFDGASCAATNWVKVDGNVADVGLNKDPTRIASKPMLGVLSNYLYASWTESNGAAQNTRAAVLSNESGAGVWTFIDGNGFSGLNKSTNRAASNPFLLQFGIKLYNTWSESNGTNTTIRVNVAK